MSSSNDVSEGPSTSSGMLKQELAKETRNDAVKDSMKILTLEDAQFAVEEKILGEQKLKYFTDEQKAHFEKLQEDSAKKRAEKVSEGSSSSSKKKKYLDFRTSKNITSQDYVDDRDRVMRLWNEYIQENFPNMESEVDELIKRRAENKREPTIYEKVLSMSVKRPDSS